VTLVLPAAIGPQEASVHVTTSNAVIGFPRESTTGDRRTLLTSAIVRLLTEAEFTVLAEPGIATGIDCPDQALTAEGVRFATADQVSMPLS